MGAAWCMAEMADAAEWPDDEGAGGCGLAFDILDVGSPFEDDHRPRFGFFRGPQPPGSPSVEVASPFIWGGAGGAAAIVVEVDIVDEVDEFELVRWRLFRGAGIRV